MKDNQRERLANRRLAETFDLSAGGLSYTCTVGRYPDGRLAEIFLSCVKSSSHADAFAREAAIAGSLALQRGCEFETLRRAVLRNPDGSAASPLGVALDLIAAETEAVS